MYLQDVLLSFLDNMRELLWDYFHVLEIKLDIFFRDTTKQFLGG